MTVEDLEKGSRFKMLRGLTVWRETCHGLKKATIEVDAIGEVVKTSDNGHTLTVVGNFKLTFEHNGRSFSAYHPIMTSFSKIRDWKSPQSSKSEFSERRSGRNPYGDPTGGRQLKLSAFPILLGRQSKTPRDIVARRLADRIGLNQVGFSPKRYAAVFPALSRPTSVGLFLYKIFRHFFIKFAKHLINM